MISSFVRPYPNETWQSILARYHDRNGNQCFSETAKELFGPGYEYRSKYRLSMVRVRNWTQLITENPDFPIPIDQILLKHTPAPFLAAVSWSLMPPFIAASRAPLSDTCTKEKTAARAVWNLVPVALRYCPICWEEDIRTYGERYWHRDHALKFLDYCPRHHCRLVSMPMQKSSSVTPAQSVTEIETPVPADKTFPAESIVLSILDSEQWPMPVTDSVKDAMTEAGLCPGRTVRGDILHDLGYTPWSTQNALFTEPSIKGIFSAPHQYIPTFLHLAAFFSRPVLFSPDAFQNWLTTLQESIF